MSNVIQQTTAEYPLIHTGKSFILQYLPFLNKYNFVQWYIKITRQCASVTCKQILKRSKPCNYTVIAEFEALFGMSLNCLWLNVLFPSSQFNFWGTHYTQLGVSKIELSFIYTAQYSVGTIQFQRVISIHMRNWIIPQKRKPLLSFREL